MKKIIYILFLLPFTFGCSNDKVSSDSKLGGEEGTEVMDTHTPLDDRLEKDFAKPYGIRIIYRFLEREINRGYTFTPTKYEKAIVFSNVFNYLFIEPYVKITSKQFMKEHSFNTVILIGEPAFAPNGTKYVGFAVAGVKIHLLEMNHIKTDNIYYLNENVLATLYHENAHTWHQSKLFTSDYERVSASDYKRDNWSVWAGDDYLKAGFITAYSSFDKDEDFVEMIARYIVYYNASLDCGCDIASHPGTDSDSDGFNDTLYQAWKAKFVNYGALQNPNTYRNYFSTKVWEEELKAADAKIRPTETYTGKQKIEQKIAIIKNYLTNEWNINLDELRAEIRSRYPSVVGKDFDGNQVLRKDFTVLPNN